jgi:hypothetical protein
MATLTFGFALSKDLQILIDGCNKALTKRILVASERTAIFLNNVFAETGPSHSLREFLGGEDGKSLLKRVLPPRTYAEGTGGHLFPLRDGAPRPLLKVKDWQQLQSAIGLMRQFNVSQNSAQPGGEPFLSFGAPPYITGGHLLPTYGPMMGRMLDVVIPALGDGLAAPFASMKTPSDVDQAFKIKFRMSV